MAVPSSDQLVGLSPARVERFEHTARQLAACGAELVPVDLADLLSAGRLLYGGALVAERYAAFGSFLDSAPEDVDPVVAALVGASASIPATQLVNDMERLDGFRRSARALFARADALLVPTTTEHPTIAEVAADPTGVNARLGTYTTFANLLDLAAVAVPAGEADGAYCGVTVLAPAFHDRVAADIARSVVDPASRGVSPQADVVGRQPALPLVVVGAHMSGHSLNHQLTDRGARLVGPVSTSADYRLYALPTTPAKPGLVPAPGRGAAVSGEMWLLPPASLAALLATLPAPMALGPVQLADGTACTGFLCPSAVSTAGKDITAFGGWSAYLRSMP